MAGRLSLYVRERTVHLWEDGSNVSRIVTILEEEGTKTSRATVRKWIFRWKCNRGLKDEHRCGRPSLVTTDISAFIEKKT